MTIPTGTESARAFLPAKDFKLSKAFYEALGFRKLLDGDVAIFGVGEAGLSGGWHPVGAGATCKQSDESARQTTACDPHTIHPKFRHVLRLLLHSPRG
jgi:hypothetical protein